MSRGDDRSGIYALMERYIDGDRRAFTELHGRLAPRLRGVLFKLVHDPATVDDLVQVTLLKAHLARHRFELRGGDPDGAVLAWYYAIARNAAMDRLRKQGREAQRRAPEDPARAGDRLEAHADLAPDAEQLVLDVESEARVIADVRAAIARLPPGQREVIELHKLGGLSMAEVAARLDLREGAVRVRAHRAYRALARLLGAFVLLWGDTTQGGGPAAAPHDASAAPPRPAPGPLAGGPA